MRILEQIGPRAHGLRIRHGPAVRLWAARDVEQPRRYKPAHYRKGRGRKKKRA